jgi:hypothetical protein
MGTLRGATIIWSTVQAGRINRWACPVVFCVDSAKIGYNQETLMTDTEANQIEVKLFEAAMQVKTEVPIPRLAVAQIIHAIVPVIRTWLGDEGAPVSYGLHWDSSTAIKGEQE